MADQQQTTTTIVQNADIRATVVARLLEWVGRQDSLVVVLLSILIVLVTGAGIGIRYTVTTLVPAHLEQIQQGYERIQRDAAAQQKELTDRYISDKQHLREIHTQELQAISRDFKAIAERMETVAKGQEVLIRDIILREQKKIGITPPSGGE